MKYGTWFLDEQDTRQKQNTEVCCSKCLIVSVKSFHLYFDKQVYKKLKKKKKKQAKKLKAWFLLNQTRTEKQTRAAALRHAIIIFFFSLIGLQIIEQCHFVSCVTLM